MRVWYRRRVLPVWRRVGRHVHWQMLARVCSAAVLGIDAYLVDVEIDISSGMPSSTRWDCPRAR